MRNETFWELVSAYGTKDISLEDSMKVITSEAKSYEEAIADYSLLVKRTITPEEKLQIKELLKKNEKKSKDIN